MVANILYPSDLIYVTGVQFHQVVWDPTRAAQGIVFQNENRLVTQNVALISHKCVMGTVGFTTGVHYWNLEIIDDAATKYIMIGVSKNASLTTSTYPGANNDKGVSYYGANGYRYFANTHAAFGPAFKKGDVVGVLLNMGHKTVTFYLNGQRVGTAIGIDQLTDDIYYPCVALYTLGHAVVSRELPEGIKP